MNKFRPKSQESEKKAQPHKHCVCPECAKPMFEAFRNGTFERTPGTLSALAPPGVDRNVKYPKTINTRE